MLGNQTTIKLIFGAAVATLLVSPTLAQSYSATYGTGNIINLPLAAQTNGAAGIGTGAYNGANSYAHAPSSVSAFAYSPPRRPVKHYRTSAAPDLSIRSQR